MPGNGSRFEQTDNSIRYDLINVVSHVTLFLAVHPFARAASGLVTLAGGGAAIVFPAGEKLASFRDEGRFF